MNSYTSQTTSIAALIQEAFCAYRSRSEDVPGHVAGIFRNLAILEERIAERYGIALRGMDILDIGAGQFLTQMMYFSRHNNVVGVDWDIIARGVDPIQYLRMLISNGPWRTAKTLVRKFLGIDRKYREAALKFLNLSTTPRLTVYRMDACKMTFSNESFDFAHSYSVFHHLPRPEAGIDEVARILRPGGVAYIAFHLFTSETGSLDSRVFRDERGEIVRWAHLRPAFKAKIIPNAYLNRLRLAEWRTLFNLHMPGASFIFNTASRPILEQEAQSLIERGELQSYSLEELLVHDVTVLWLKPY